MGIKGTKVGSKSNRRQPAAIYTQSQVDLLLQDQMRSHRQVAHELRQLVLDLSRTRCTGRQPEQVEVSKAALLRVLTKSADLADL